MSSSLRRIITSALLVSVLTFAGVFVLKRLVYSYNVTVYFNNIKSVDIYKEGSSEAIASVNTSGQLINLARGVYIFQYFGNQNYEDKYITRSINRDIDLVFDASYSKSKLDSILQEEQPLISSEIGKKYPRFNLYKLGEGKLYRNGAWYGGLLVYRGNDELNSDPLRIILQKQNDVWRIKTDPPNIYLSKQEFSQIPNDIIRDVNSL